MLRRGRFLLLLAFLAGVAVLSAQHAPSNPILILVSFDGWRHDYIDRLPAANLRALAARGARAKAMIP